MNLQNLIPTDNMYKFLAITGLVIAIYAITIPYAKIQELERQNIVNLGERELIILEWSQLEELSENHKDNTENLTSRVFRLAEKNKKIPEALANELKNKLYGTIEEKKELIQKKHLFKQKELQYNNKINLYDYNLKLTKSYTLIGWILGILGVFLSIFGFTLWHTRSQRHQDLIIKQQANELNNKNLTNQSI